MALPDDLLTNDISEMIRSHDQNILCIQSTLVSPVKDTTPHCPQDTQKHGCKTDEVRDDAARNYRVVHDVHATAQQQSRSQASLYGSTVFMPGLLLCPWTVYAIPPIDD
jgi:hypothetical protein